MANYRPAAARVARKYGIPVPLFLTLVKWESNGNPAAVSPAGAIGYTQLMPGTARGLGVDPHNPVQNLDGGARYLLDQYKRFGSWRLALAAYNAGPNAVAKYNGVPPYAETQRYVKGILAAAGNLGAGPAPQPLPAGPGAAPTTVTAPPPTAPQPPDLTGAAVGTLAHIAAHQFSPQESLAALTQSVAEQRAVVPPVPPQTPAAPTANPQAPGAPAGNWRKWVTLADGADRAGAKTSPAVLRFVARIAQAYGDPLTIGTGTNHNQYVINTHRQSAHWTGRAADIPATGENLRRLGFLALVAAGMSRGKAKAAAAKGGLFNVGRYQVIFDTMEGGNHYTHLHVGVR